MNYYGWTNRETWACYNWLTSQWEYEQAALEYMRSYELPEEGLEYFIQQEWPLYINSDSMELAIYKDIGSLWRIDYKQIVDKMLGRE